VLSGRDDKAPAAKTAARSETATPEATPAALAAQVETLDSLLKRSARGRAAAVRGDFEAAAAGRSDLLRRLRRLERQTDDAELKAATTSFAAAVRESLRQNRECKDACSERELQRVGRLKETALKKINPLLEAQGLDTYTATDI
jgi:hypothetical protein